MPGCEREHKGKFHGVVTYCCSNHAEWFAMKTSTASSFTLPACSSTSPNPAKPASARRRSILVVDDEEYMLSLLREILQTLGYRPLTAANGSQALELLSTAPVDLVITDIHMPGISGLELLQRVKLKQPQTPVVLITGFGVERAARAARDHHADGFLGKPFHIEELRLCIDRLLS